MASRVPWRPTGHARMAAPGRATPKHGNYTIESLAPAQPTRPMSPDTPTSKTRHIIRRSGLVLLAMATTLLLAEGGLRCWLRVRGEPFDSAQAEAEISSILQGVAGLAEGVAQAPGAEGGATSKDRLRPRSNYILHPYTGYSHSQGLATTEEAIQYFSAGQPRDEYSVFIMGGSVAAGLQSSGAQALEDILGNDLGLDGRSMRLFGFAVPGYKQPQQLLLLTFLLAQGCSPDLVINLDGLNELRVTLSNTRKGLDPIFPSVGHWASLLGSTHGGITDDPGLLYGMLRPQQEATDLALAALRQGHVRSALLTRQTLSRLRHLRAEWAAGQELVVEARAERNQTGASAGFGGVASRKLALDHGIRTWYESSLGMHDLCSPKGIRYLHWLQPTLHDAGSKPIHPAEQVNGIGEKGMNQEVVLGYPLLRERLGELRGRGVEALDTSDAFQNETRRIYRDSCHLTSDGNRLLLERVAALLRE